MNSDLQIMPRLRPIEPVELAVQGRRVIGLKDPLQLSDNVLCFHHEALPLLAMLDGKHSLLDIQAHLTARTGRIVFLDEIKGLLEKLDESFLLEGDRFRKAFEQKTAAYRQNPFRPSSHAGKSYSDDPDKLKGELGSHFEAEMGGPGHPELFSDSRRPVGIVAPHIDIRAGGKSFAHAYHALASGQPSDIYVILGTGHAGVEKMFTACSLDFQTPLGIVQTDRDLLDLLSSEIGRDAAQEEILHATEHVIEFQLVFLQYIFSNRHQFTILPILCSLSYNIFGKDESFAAQREVFKQFCAAVKKICRKSSKSVCFVASADLDHIGPQYGDSFVPHQGTVARAIEKDGELMGSLERLDINDFISRVAIDSDARRICGFSPITAMFHCMEASEAKLLSLDHACVDDKNSFVSFASMIFH